MVEKLKGETSMSFAKNIIRATNEVMDELKNEMHLALASLIDDKRCEWDKRNICLSSEETREIVKDAFAILNRSMFGPEDKISATESLMHKTVTVTVDRPMGTYHPEHKEIFYPVNYGHIEGATGSGGEEQGAYILGVDKPVEKFTGWVIARACRLDDFKEKLIIVPDGMFFTEEEIEKQIEFQEKYFNSIVMMK